MKKRLLVLALIPFMLGACGGNNTSDGGDNGEQQTIKYTVHFANTSMEDV